MSFPRIATSTQTKIFLDIHSQVIYEEIENEEGLLGLAFHPKYKQNGTFFVYYTTTDAPHTSVISRFRVSADDPDRADPTSEEGDPAHRSNLLEPQRRHTRVRTGRISLHRPGRRRLIERSARARPESGHAAWLDLENRCGSLGRGQGLCHSPRQSVCRSSRQLDQKSGPMGCAMCGGWHSIAERAILWAADNGEDLWEEIDIDPTWRQLRLESARRASQIPAAGIGAARGSDRADLGVSPSRRHVDHRWLRLSWPAPARRSTEPTSTEIMSWGLCGRCAMTPNSIGSRRIEPSKAVACR